MGLAERSFTARRTSPLFARATRPTSSSDRSTAHSRSRSLGVTVLPLSIDANPGEGTFLSVPKKDTQNRRVQHSFIEVLFGFLANDQFSGHAGSEFAV